jgi:hypothetical protein
VRQLGDGYALVLADHRKLLRAAVESCSGHVVDHRGDEFFMVFQDAKQAAQAVAEAQRAFAAFFRENNLPVEERSGGSSGSDDAAFSQKGIATVSLYTGAGRPKPEVEARLFGGTAGRPFDPCYHRPCDTVDNINREVLEQHTQALVRALGAAAMNARSAGAPLQNVLEP